MTLAIVIAVVAVVALFVTHPLRRGVAERIEVEHEARIEDLETAKTAKYREIRDAEMDHRTGKLSEADWRALDRQLRGEAVDILHELDELTPPASS